MKNLSLPSICTNTFFRNHIAAFFALISLCLVFNTSAQDKVPAVYIGSIPDQIHYFDPHETRSCESYNCQLKVMNYSVGYLFLTIE